MRRTVKLNSITGVTPGSKAIIRIVDVLAYHGIFIALTNLTAAQLTNIRVFYNDSEAMSFTGTDLDKMLQHYGHGAVSVDSRIFIPFCGPGLLNQQEEEGTAVHVGVPYKDGTVIKSIRVEIDIDGAAVAPGIVASALVRDAISGRLPWFPFVRASNVDVQSGGIKAINDIVDKNSSREAFCTEVFFKTAQMTALRVARNGVDQFDRIAADNLRAQRDGVRTPVAGWFVFDARENGYGDAPDALQAQGANTLIWFLTMTAAEVMPTYVWTIGPMQ